MPNSSSPSAAAVCYGNFTEAQLALVQPIRLELFVVFFVLPLLVSSFCYIRVPSNTQVIMADLINVHVLLATYILTFLIGLPANILAFYAFSQKARDNPTPTDILLLNLTSSDLLFLLFLPLKMYEAGQGLRWYLPRFLCSLTSFMFFTTIYTSSLLLTAVSVDRFLAVAFPIRYRQLRKPRYAICTAALAWLVSSAHCSIVFVTEHLLEAAGNSSRPRDKCYEDFSGEQLRVLVPVRLEFFVVLCVLPLLICVFCYANCIRILYSKPRIPPERKRKAIGMAVGTLTVFLVCFLPYNSAHLVGFLTGSSPEWRYYTLLLSTFNTCLDPIIFYFSSSAFRTTTKVSIVKMLMLNRTNTIQKDNQASRQTLST
ncbi:free fatty acid receptor 3-like isoform X1 [Alosa pseudoharengus]|uniref:free fatty acid receptor 3-like isoform X1 n=2 Tax=Alosa pseudoharengus TaxID=34774 RepID=UPI003F8C00BF